MGVLGAADGPGPGVPPVHAVAPAVMRAAASAAAAIRGARPDRGLLVIDVMASPFLSPMRER